MTSPNAPPDPAVKGSPSAPPQRIAGRYRVRGLLGQGGFGQVYEAYDELAEREVALKLIRKDSGGDLLDSRSRKTRDSSAPHTTHSSPRTFGTSRRPVTRSTFGHTSSSITSEAAQAFRDEFRLLTQLHHPNLAGVHDFGRCSELDALYFTQDLVRGKTLTDYLKGASRETIVEVFVQLARALDYIHALGLVHDDIKPSNVLVAPSEDDPQRPQAKLIDFGLAHILRGERALPRTESAGDTEGIVVLGTPGYAAPEKVRGHSPDARSDIYSLAAMLYAAIRGQRPFPGKSFKEVLRAQRDWRPELAGALLPAAGEVVADLVGRMLQPDPSERPQSARAIVLELLRREASHLPQRGTGAEDRKEFARLLVEQLPFVDRAGYLELLIDKANTVLLRTADHASEAGASRSGSRSHLIRTVLIEAPEGMGKRRLMAELRREIQLGDGLFVEASCWGSDPSALGPFAPLVVQLAASLGDKSAANRAFPQLVKLARGEDVPGTAAQQLMEYLIAASRERPYVLHLSALSHAPEAVRVQFDQLCRAVDHNEVPIMVCATSEPHTKITPLFQTLHREQLAESWRLRPFQSREMYDLLRGTLGETPILPELTNMLDKLTGGHPLSVRETLRALIEENVLSRDADSWTLRGAAAATEVLHKSLTQRSEARLDALGISAWEVASVLYLLEAPIEEDMLGELTELRRRRFVRTLERLEGEGLIARAATGNASMIQLAHDSVRQAVHHRYGDSLNETRLDLATRIDELGIEDPQFIYLRARLLDDASEGTESCAELEAAAQALFEAAQPQLGARVLDRLITRLRRHGGVESLPRLLAAKLDLLEQAAGALEDPRKELQGYQIGIFIAELLGDHRAEAKFWLGLADRYVHDTSEDTSVAIERLDAATRAATLAKDDHLVLRIANRRAEILLGAGDVEQATAWSEKAMAIMDQPGVHDADKSHVAGVRLRCLVLSGRFREAWELHEAVREMAAGVPVLRRQSYLSGVGYLGAFSGDPQRVIPELEHAIEELRAANLNRLLLTPLHNLGDLLLRSDELERSEAAFEEALRLAALYGYDYHVYLNRGFLGYVLARRGSLQEGAELLGEAKASMSALLGDQVSLQQLKLLDAEVAHMLGQSARARRELEEMLADFHESREVSLAQWAQEALARIEKDLGTGFVVATDSAGDVSDPDEDTVKTRPLR